MRAMLPMILIPVLLLGVTPALAQLPPEILADAHLLRAEQAISDGDPTRARAEIDKIILLQKEHELNLSEEFLFRCAKSAAAAALPEQALEAVIKYLTATGREGPHYVEALELMNRAQDEIAGRKEPQVVYTGQPPRTQEASQVPVDVVLAAGGATEPAPAPDCDLRAWNTSWYFRTATVQSVEDCLAAGANPEARDDVKKTPLHEAAGTNTNPEVIKVLLAAGADLEARTNFKTTPLHWAARSNTNPEVIKALLAAGADPEARTDDKETPLYRAARSNTNPEVIEVLLAAGAKAHDDMKWTPLHRVVFSNDNLADIEALLKAGADAKARDKWKQTPLHRAAGFNKNPEVIKVLLAAGANLEARCNVKGTPLHWAALTNTNPEVIKALLKAGADAKARDKWKQTPLHYNTNPEVIEVLLAAGADLEARNNAKRTPLHRAAESNENPAVIEALLAAGADLGALDKDGRTPLQIAKKVNENPAVRQALLAAGAGQIERQRAAARARRKAQSGPGFLDAAIGIIGGTAIAAAGGGSEEALAAGTAFAEGVISGRSPAGSSAGARDVAPTGNAGAGASGGQCEIPGYPRPADVKNLGLSWCPATVDFQVRSLALHAAGAQCAIAIGSSSTPEQIQARRQEIQAVCARLAALDVPNCRCP